jgi:hypothetical protein
MSQQELIEEPKFEILPPDVKTASTELSCPADKVAALYAPFEKPFENAAALLAEEEKATTATDARALRLRMVKARTTITSTKDISKCDIKLAGNIIDWFHNTGCTRLKESEARLLEVEKAEERAEAARLEAIREERAETLDSMGHNYHGINLGTMTDEAWTEYLQQAKDVYEMRELRKKREAEEAAAELARQEAEREAQRIENERIQAEAKAKAEAAELERQKALAALEAERKERAAAEEKARKEREAIEAKAKAEQAKRDAAAKAEREKIEAAAAEERRKAIEAAAIEAKKRQEAEAEAKALRDAEAKRIAENEAKAKAVADEIKRAAKAPDKAKLQAFADSVRSMQVPSMKTDLAKEVAEDIKVKIEQTADWIEAMISTL